MRVNLIPDSNFCQTVITIFIALWKISVFEWKVLTSAFVSVGSGVEKAIGEAVVQIDMVPGKDRKVNVKGKTKKHNS